MEKSNEWIGRNERYKRGSERGSTRKHIDFHIWIMRWKLNYNYNIRYRITLKSLNIGISSGDFFHYLEVVTIDGFSCSEVISDNSNLNSNFPLFKGHNFHFNEFRINFLCSQIILHHICLILKSLVHNTFSALVHFLSPAYGFISFVNQNQIVYVLVFLAFYHGSEVLKPLRNEANLNRPIKH